jgi:hypothetical protein
MIFAAVHLFDLQLTMLCSNNTGTKTEASDEQAGCGSYSVIFGLDSDSQRDDI